MAQPTILQIKPEWLGDEATAKAKKFTAELEKQKKAVDGYKNLAYALANVGNEAAKQEKKVRAWSAAFGDVFKQIGENRTARWEQFFSRNETGMDRLIKKSRELRQDLGAAFEISTARGVGYSLNKFTSGIDGAIGKVFNLKNAIAATLIGGATYGLASKALRGGIGNVRDDARIRREFQGSLAGGVRGSVEEIAQAAGIEGGDALAALTPIARAIKETRVGSRLKSGQALKSQSEVERVQKQTLDLATRYTKRLLTIFPEAQPEEVGRLLAEAGTGEEGVGSLARFVGLGKASTRDILDEAKKKKLAIGDIVGKVLERGGVTDQAAGDQRKTFDFQIKSIGSQLDDAIGNVGTSAIERLNKSLGEGTTLAEKLQKYLGSDEGKKMIDALGDSLSKVVGFAGDLAKQIPDTIKWITEHKGTLLAIAGVYGAAKVGGVVSSAVGSLGAAKDFIASRGASPANPLFVSQVGGPGAPGGGGPLDLVKKVGTGLSGVAAAGGVGAGLLLAAAGGAAAYGGYKAGDYLGKHVAPIGKGHDFLANALYNLTGEGDADKKTSDYEGARHRAMLAAKNQQRELAVQQIMLTTGASRGQALNAVDHPNAAPAPAPQVNVVVKLGEKELAAAAHAETQRQATNEARNQAGM